MQNTKIQTLWNLCNELKEKRQFLVDRLKHTQDYLDEQQFALSREVHALRQQHTDLEQDVYRLHQSVEQAFQLLAAQHPQTSQTVGVHDFLPLQDCAAQHLELYGRFQVQNTILHLLQPEVMHVDAPVVFREAFQELFEEFQEHAELFQRSSSAFVALQEKFFAGADEVDELAALGSSFSSYSEFLTSFSEDLHGFQAQWQAAIVYRKGSASADDVGAVKQELERLKERYDCLEQDKYAREALLAGAFSQAYACTSALLDLQHNHDALASDLRQLEYALIAFQQNFQKGASSAPSDPDAAETEEAPESDRQAVREALQENTRKRVAQVLRKRFGKVPRRVHQLLKTIEVSSRLDKFFELSLETESLDAFTQALEPTAV